MLQLTSQFVPYGLYSGSLSRYSLSGLLFQNQITTFVSRLNCPAKFFLLRSLTILKKITWQYKDFGPLIQYIHVKLLGMNPSQYPHYYPITIEIFLDTGNGLASRISGVHSYRVQSSDSNRSDPEHQQFWTLCLPLHCDISRRCSAFEPRSPSTHHHLITPPPTKIIALAQMDPTKRKRFYHLKAAQSRERA